MLACSHPPPVGGDSDPNLKNRDLFQSPDTGRGVQARSWRANRDVDVRRQFLGFCLRVHLFVLLLDGLYGGEKNNRFVVKKKI